MLECVNRRNEKFARKFLHILIVLIYNTSTIRVIDFFRSIESIPNRFRYNCVDFHVYN